MREGALAVWEILDLAGTVVAQTFDPDVPHAWNDKDVKKLEVPLAQRDRSPRYSTAEQYYASRVRTIYRTYPVHAPAATAGKKARTADTADSASQTPLTAYVEVSNVDCKLVYLDDTLQSITIGAVVHRDILLPAGALGNPPCEPGTSASVPYPEK